MKARKIEVQSRSRQEVTIDKVKYPSRTAAAQALVASGNSLAEAARLTGMTYQTVYATTKGKEKAAARRVQYHAVALGKSGKSTAGEIAKKTGLSTSKVVSLLKAKSIVVLTKDVKPVNTPKVKTPKVVKAVKATKVPVPLIDFEDDIANLPIDEEAMLTALSDMKDAQ